MMDPRERQAWQELERQGERLVEHGKKLQEESDNLAKALRRLEKVNAVMDTLTVPLPPADVIALAEEAERAGCLSEAGRLWLRRVRSADGGRL